MTDRTLTAKWTGEAFELPPVSRMKCKGWLQPGELVTLEISKPRNRNNHKRFMARVKEIWQSLPEHMRHAPFAQSPDHLRYHALIEAGVCDTTTHVSASRAEAERVAATFHTMSGYAVVQIVDKTVMRHTALSQAFAKMSGEQFRKSARAAEDWMMGLLEGRAA